MIKLKSVRAFTLAEAVLGIGLAAVLVLAIMGLTTSALSGDQKAEMKHIALALANSELENLARSVSLADSAARISFWRSVDGPFVGVGTRPSIRCDFTDFSTDYQIKTIENALVSKPLGHEKTGNRMRKVDLTLSWWNGTQGKPGYGKMTVTAAKLFRESDLREP